MIIFFCPTPDPENPAKFLLLGKAFDDCTILTDVKFVQNPKLAANFAVMSFFPSETETDTIRFFITR